MRQKEKPPMNPDTRRFLEKFMTMENRGLSDLIGVDVTKYWNYMKKDQ